MNRSKTSQQYLFYILGILLFFTSFVTSAATLKFSYTSDTDGYLGFFTVDESVFNANIDIPSEGWLKNQYIEDLQFSFRGDMWTKEDIYKDDYTIIYSTDGVAIPTVQGGAGLLASFNYPKGNIVLYGDNFMNIGDAVLIHGAWSTSYVTSVPEPSNYGSLIAGLLLIGFYLSTHKRS